MLLFCLSRCLPFCDHSTLLLQAFFEAAAAFSPEIIFNLWPMLTLMALHATLVWFVTGQYDSRMPEAYHAHVDARRA
jgi:hypothetical protein